MSRKLKRNSDPRAQRVLHVGCPNLGDRDQFDALVNSMFRRRWFTNHGNLVQELESQLAHHLDVKHCIAVCNGTAGLQLACRALNLTGEIILPSFTFVATPHAVRWQRLQPVFADINPNSHCLSVESVESLINERTSAILGVHLWGNSCKIDELEELAQQHGLKLIFDAAHAFSCSTSKAMIGNFGDCEVFSFHATKFFNTFEGGAIATNDDELADRIRLMRNFGFSSMDHTVDLGINAKMPEICAAMGLSMIDSIESIRRRNQLNHQTYKSLLGNQPGLRLLSFDHMKLSNWQYVVLEIEEKRFGRSRDQVFDQLHANQIRARRYFYPGCHRLAPYCDEPSIAVDLSNTETVCSKVLCLPTGTAIEQRDIVRVCNVVLGSASLGNVG